MFSYAISFNILVRAVLYLCDEVYIAAAVEKHSAFIYSWSSEDNQSQVMPLQCFKHKYVEFMEIYINSEGVIGQVNGRLKLLALPEVTQLVR